MAYNVKKLLAMTESELADLFSRAEAGPVPNSEVEGTATVAAGTNFTSEMDVS